MTDHLPILLQHCDIYQGKTRVLHDVNLEMAKGEFAYLVGKTGTGKSSLLKTLYADLPLKQGEGRVADYPLKKIRRRKIPHLRRKLGIVFQDFQLLDDRTVYDNLMFVMKATGWHKKADMKKRCDEMLEKVQLIGKGSAYPHQLSGGEQQRVAIARALINNPEIILADEPTGNLDPETSEGILQLLFEISKGGTAILMATHDYTIMEKFPFKTYRCADHQITQVGSASGFNPLKGV